MKLRLKDSYRGKRTNERVIAPGDYDLDDKRLFGISDYLLENGYAVRVNKDGKPAAVTTTAAGGEVYFTNVSGEPVPVVIGTNPELTPAEVQEVVNRYHLALELKARAETAIEAEERAGDFTPQGDDVYQLRQPLSTALDSDLVTVPGKGIVPDVKLPRVVWEMGRNVVFPVDAPAPDIQHLEDLDDALEADQTDEAHVNWVDTAEYRDLQRERADALMAAGDEDSQRQVNDDFAGRERAAESKWNEARVMKPSKPKSKKVGGK
jgi:hypothetical protein